MRLSTLFMTTMVCSHFTPCGAESHALSSQALMAAAEIKLTPQAIAASGLGSSTAVILDRLSQAPQEAEIVGHRTALSAASAELVHVQSLLAANPSDVTLIAQQTQLKSTIQATELSLASAQQSLWNEVTSGLSAEPVTRLSILRSNSARKAPAEFGVAVRDDAAWHAIELAIISEARSQRRGTPVSVDAATLLANIRAEPDVVAAAQRLTADLATVQHAFDQLAQ